ncbi:MAG TPA: hypothetical protein P5137_14275 [Candidatus Brocadiia bacterium]|nr:hypothetical protein [Candidatus Brocadiia bacterium]
MAKKGIGVEISGRCVRAARVALTGGRLVVEWASRRDAPDTGDAEASANAWTQEAVESLLQEGGAADVGAVAVALGDHEVFFHAMVSDLPDVGRVRKVLAFEVEDDMPAMVEGLILEVEEAGALPGGRRRYLAGGAPAAGVRRVEEAVRRAGGRAVAVSSRAHGLAVAALWRRRAAENAPFVVCSADEGAGLVAICQGERIVTARQLGRIAVDGGVEAAGGALGAEIELTWRRAFGQPLAPGALIVLVSAGAPAAGSVEALKTALGRGVDVVDVLAEANVGQEAGAGGCSPVAIGMALRAMGQGKAMNFLEPETREKAETAGSRLALTVTGLLLALACAAWVGRVMLEKQRLEDRSRHLRAEIRRTFAAVSSGDGQVRDEVAVAMIDEKLRAARKEYDVLASIAGGDAPPLRVLQLISSLTPANVNAAISEISISGSTARIKGTIDSFESLDRFKASLLRAKEFTKVVESAGLGRNATTLQFTMVITVAAR